MFQSEFINTLTVINKLNEVIVRCGVPKVIISGGVKCFTSGKFQGYF